MTDYTSNLTHELTEMIREERYARTLANIARRAENLWDDGYKFEKFADDFFHIISPKGDRYAVILDREPLPACDCPAFAKYGECKHHLAIEWMLRDEKQAEVFDMMMANAEGPHGTDPDIRW